MLKLGFFRFHKIVVRKRRPKRVLITTKEREDARVLVHTKLAEFNQHYNYVYNKVFIKSQRTRWGSCSSNRNLNFNYKIIYLPREAQDYLIVHELVHLKEFNHSQRFWDLVAETIPEYERIGDLLRRGKYLSL